MALRTIIIGAGGWGGTWCRSTLPRAAAEGLIEVVAAVDLNPENLRNARVFLGLREEECYTDLRAALAAVKAEACVVATPPDTHEEIVSAALESGCEILCEKPIAHTLEASVRILEKVRSAGRKMGVTMSHRYNQLHWTLRDQVRTGGNGRLDYAVFNFSWNKREKNKPRQARLAHDMLIEGAVHHLDILAELAGAGCETIYAEGWTPEWGNYTGASQALITMRFGNGVRAAYESAWCNASTQNPWGAEYVRAECDRATLVMSRGRIERFPEEDNRGELAGFPVKLRENPKWGNDYLLDAFVRWAAGGPSMETEIEANIRSMALVFAAIESVETGMPVKVREFAGSRGIILP